ncbi:hypothetical protein NP493_8246g00002 [Ridgeia piscesae]|uniref:Uncharacterized protein n=1 Tax=Ridgeia piscesae TaxID=27915 RepID=A0AAD9IPF6_RIDPI|nr:hypothetical protein NP493_8246g00002 [Ridgeia piscesae]
MLRCTRPTGKGRENHQRATGATGDSHSLVLPWRRHP